MKKLSNKTKMEILVGRLVILIIQSLIGVGLVLGFFYLIGMLLNWVEHSTFRTIAFFTISGIVLIKMFFNEINR